MKILDEIIFCVSFYIRVLLLHTVLWILRLGLLGELVNVRVYGGHLEGGGGRGGVGAEVQSPGQLVQHLAKHSQRHVLTEEVE